MAFEFLKTSRGLEKIKRADLKKILENPLVVTSWNEWSRWRRYGLPLGRGIYDEPYRWTRVVETIETEFQIWEGEQMQESTE